MLWSSEFIPIYIYTDKSKKMERFKNVYLNFQRNIWKDVKCEHEVRSLVE